MPQRVTDRQLEILRAIMDQFLSKNKMLISSSVIVKEYDVDACAATVRNDMVVLEDKGFIKKPHISAGRLPSTAGIKYYLTHLLKEENIPLDKEEEIKAQVSTNDGSFYKMLNTAIEILSEETNEAAFLHLNDIRIQKNLYKLFKYEELSQNDTISSILQLLEDKKHLQKITKYVNDDVFAIVGEDLQYLKLNLAALVGVKFSGLQKDHEGLIGVIASKRLNYAKVIPLIRLIGNTMQKNIVKWRW
jgi:heat-inducible transcriptional repressor